MATAAPPKTTPRKNYAPSGELTTAVVFAFVIVASLYFARTILMPFALAVLLSFILAPLVRRLQLWYVPRSLAVTSVVLFAFGIIAALGYVMVGQVNQLASDLPRYESTLREKIRAIRGSAAPGPLERATEVLQDLSEELNRPEGQPGAVAPAPGEIRPVPVEVREPDPGPLRTLVALITPLLNPLATTGLVIIFVFFILWQRQELRNRLVRIAGAQDLQRTTKALNDAGQRLSRLFLTQLALNASFGLLVGIGWYFIGLPSAALWGILTMILRFMPYIGTWISAVFPLLLAAAVGPDWTMFIWAAIIFLVVDILIGVVVEPMMQGHSTGVSPVAVVVAATFWTWLWGPIGLVLATPITLCLVVLGRYVERLSFFHVLLGDQPALTPPELTYQRMLARDPVEATEQARDYLKTRPLLSYYEEILVGGLKLAQADAARGLLDEEGRGYIREATAEVLDDLRDHVDKPKAVATDENTPEKPLAQLSKVETAALDPADDLPGRWREKNAVLCIPGVSELDEALAMVLAQLAERQGLGVGTESAGALSMQRIFGLNTDGTLLICVCYLEDATPAQVRYALRRLRRKAPEAYILVALFGNGEAFAEEDVLIDSAKVGFVKGSLEDTLKAILSMAKADRTEKPEDVTPLRQARAALADRM
jgi:predicted PurR-regulated permease PerM